MWKLTVHVVILLLAIHTASVYLCIVLNHKQTKPRLLSMWLLPHMEIMMSLQGDLWFFCLALAVAGNHMLVAV